MAEEKTPKSSDDWLKVLSVFALMSKDAPQDASGTAVIAAFVIVGLSIYSRTIFALLYLAATGFLIWAAIDSGEPFFTGYALLYVTLGAVLVAEGERRRLGKGHFLCATWWAGQALIHGLNAHYLSTTGSSNFFNDLFLIISIALVLRELIRGVFALIRRQDAIQYEPHLDASPAESKKAA